MDDNDDRRLFVLPLGCKIINRPKKSKPSRNRRTKEGVTQSLVYLLRGIFLTNKQNIDDSLKSLIYSTNKSPRKTLLAIKPVDGI